MFGTGFSSPLRLARVTIAFVLLAIAGASAAPASAYIEAGINVDVSPFGSSTGASYFDSTVGFPQINLVILRGGAVVASQTGTGFVYLGAAPATGDTVQLQSPPGTAFESLVYDGTPTVDASTCIGSRTVSGQRRGSAQVSAAAYVPNPASSFGSYQDAQITTLSGSSYAGVFARPLASGDYLFVDESETVPTGYGSFSYYSSFERAVGACPPPPTPPPPPAAPVAGPPKGSITIPKARLREFLKKGLPLTVTIDQAGKVSVNMFLADGMLPATASSVPDADSAKRKRKKKTRNATLIGRGNATATAAGKVKVVVRPTKKAKRKLRHKRRIKAVFLTTLSNTAGKASNLPAKRVSLKR